MNELYLMKVGNLYGFINNTGQFIIEPMYCDAREFSEELAYVKTTDRKDGYINYKNDMIC
ncbi:MAG TPA: WG repeat-containing protein [Pseudobacteroides sp.]|uniref:WG repeat-containing protein n=1 Tax=Pseudobacteroides sp. TaxID=1968840 RepID=UPI002F95CAE9